MLEEVRHNRPFPMRTERNAEQRYSVLVRAVDVATGIDEGLHGIEITFVGCCEHAFLRFPAARASDAARHGNDSNDSHHHFRQELQTRSCHASRLAKAKAGIKRGRDDGPKDRHVQRTAIFRSVQDRCRDHAGPGSTRVGSSAPRFGLPYHGSPRPLLRLRGSARMAHRSNRTVRFRQPQGGRPTPGGGRVPVRAPSRITGIEERDP
jgi:hypothetical protein